MPSAVQGRVGTGLRQTRGERGSAAIETALVTPLVVLLVLGLIQFGLWYHAQSVVIAAAQEAAAQASAEAGTTEAAQARAAQVLQGISGLADHPVVVVEPLGADRVAVTVRSQLRGIVPGLDHVGIQARSVSRLERVR